ncbi:equilibrative nucleoside transporter 2 isoform X1 [Xenopus tropicalis]|uniref:Equilibrative nucleoside transporter 2 isoform X1 n=2 Tax=Xenopus tropicalis TaxID=8364 RepID=A0A8J0SIK5_XENTR|nr:equilibrative nucleoside transporter 2 isoform X1 [Xenopus tropicalis]|eukprot:XP_012816512.1 PREDICTED: equilibrative nucleoside transporter 2 isoform X2 [Xenopus tropicalis]
MWAHTHRSTFHYTCAERHGTQRGLGLTQSLRSLLQEKEGRQKEHSRMSLKDEVQDKYRLVAVIVFILGLGTLLPWNFFITAIPYFQSRLVTQQALDRATDLNYLNTSNISERAIHADEFQFNNWMTLLAQLPLLLCTLLNSFLYQCVPEKVRIAGSMVAILFLFTVTAVLVKVEMSPQTFFDVTMATIWFINAFCAILQGSLFGLLTLLPQTYSSLFLSGQGMAGTFAALAMLLSMSSGADHRTTALGYFVTPCVGTFISIMCYLMLPRLEFAKFYFSKSASNSAKNYELDTKAELLQQDGNPENGEQKQAVHKIKEAEVLTGEAAQKVSICAVLRKIWVMALTIVLTFGVTLSVFPAITAAVKSGTTDEKWGKFFNPVCCFLIFNVMDWAGRSLTSYTLWPGPDCKFLPLIVSCRFVFIPAFMLCNISDKSYLPIVFGNDAWFIIFMILFSFTNGYFVSLSMCLAPKKVLAHESETTGAIMTFFLALGLSVGAGLSFLFNALL